MENLVALVQNNSLSSACYWLRLRSGRQLVWYCDLFSGHRTPNRCLRAMSMTFFELVRFFVPRIPRLYLFNFQYTWKTRSSENIIRFKKLESDFVFSEIITELKSSCVIDRVQLLQILILYGNMWSRLRRIT